MNIIHLDDLTDYIEPVVDIDSIKEVIESACNKSGVPSGHYYTVKSYPNSKCGLSLALYPRYDVHKLLLWIGRFAWDDDMMELLQDVVIEPCLVDNYLGTIIHFVNVEESM
jgi:hypothetical protein